MLVVVSGGGGDDDGGSVVTALLLGDYIAQSPSLPVLSSYLSVLCCRFPLVLVLVFVFCFTGKATFLRERPP